MIKAHCYAVKSKKIAKFLNEVRVTLQLCAWWSIETWFQVHF